MLPIILLVLAVSGAASARQRIVNGEVVTPHSFPSQLSLQIRSGDYYYHICGAVLIANNIALTAAHCVQGSNTHSLRVQCGAHNLHVTEQYRQTSRVLAMNIHHSYSPGSNAPAYPNDIAIMKLDTFEMTHACYIVDRARKVNSDFSGKDANITGWGRLAGNGAMPSKLKEGFVEVLSPSTCRNSYWGAAVDSDIHICVKDLGDRIYGSCNGDSGGPAYVRNGTLLVGLTSFGVVGCYTSYPSVYVRVSHYEDWIDRSINYFNRQ